MHWLTLIIFTFICMRNICWLLYFGNGIWKTGLPAPSASLSALSSLLSVCVCDPSPPSPPPFPKQFNEMKETLLSAYVNMWYGKICIKVLHFLLGWMKNTWCQTQDLDHLVQVSVPLTSQWPMELKKSYEKYLLKIICVRNIFSQVYTTIQ